MYRNLGQSSDLKALGQIVDLKGKRVMDIGCGDGQFALALVNLGAQVTAIEPNPVQAARNREAEAVPGLELLEAGAQALPVRDNSQDLLVFRFSLHHVPAALYPEVFSEAARALKPGGQLYVIEPLLEGSSQYVMELFHDETEVRTAAQAALKELTPPNFDPPEQFRYEVIRRFENFEAYVKRYGNMSYNDYALTQVTDESVRQRFEKFAVASGQVELVQPVRADLFTRLSKDI